MIKVKINIQLIVAISEVTVLDHFMSKVVADNKNIITSAGDLFPGTND